MNARLRRWPIAILTAFDRLANAIVLGDDRLTISSRAGLAREKGEFWGVVLANALDYISPGHCASALAYDRAVAALYILNAASDSAVK